MRQSKRGDEGIAFAVVMKIQFHIGICSALVFHVSITII